LYFGLSLDGDTAAARPGLPPSLAYPIQYYLLSHTDPCSGCAAYATLKFIYYQRRRLSVISGICDLVCMSVGVCLCVSAL